MDDNVLIYLPNAILDKNLDHGKLSPEISAKYLEYIRNNRTEEQVKIQSEYKNKLSAIKSLELDEKVDFNISKISVLNRISEELRSLKALILSFRTANIEFDDYYEVYCRFQELSFLHDYLRLDIENENNKIR